jgi:hypothetical protein
MAEARRKDEWNRTARVCSTLANCHRDAKKRPAPFVDDDFNPFAVPASRKPVRKAPIEALRVIFVDPASKVEIWHPRPTSEPAQPISS